MKKRMDPIEFARLRRQMADEWEKLLLQLLRNRQRCNQKFRREHPLGIYTADFYCPAAKLVVEIDGASHMTEEAREYDAERNRWMKEQGIRVLRFTCAEVEHETENVIERIESTLTEIPSPPAPLPGNSDDA